MLDFAAGGQLIEWDEDESLYFFTNPDRQEDLSENDLRRIFRDCIKGLSYRKNKKAFLKFLYNKKKKVI